MKKSIFQILSLLAAVALVFISCKTATVADTTSVLTEAKSSVERSRKLAVDFESPAYFPSDWEALEEAYTAAGKMPASNAAEIQLAAEAYNTLAAGYDEIFKKTIPLYAQAREDEIMAVRDTLVNSGFTQVFPEYLKNADDIALSALDKYEARDYYGARDTAASALEEYETLSVGARIFVTRQEIINRGFIEFDSENFERADDVAAEAKSQFDAGNREAAMANAEEALLRYNIVLANGWTAYAGNQRASALAERELAIAEKVNIASREAFRDADTVFNFAEESLKAENFQEAALNYIDAEALFILARLDTEQRRLRAEETIRLAEEKIEESNVTATEAERIIEGVSR